MKQRGLVKYIYFWTAKQVVVERNRLHYISIVNDTSVKVNNLSDAPYLILPVKVNNPSHAPYLMLSVLDLWFA